METLGARVDELLRVPRATYPDAELARLDACVDNILGRGDAGAAQNRHVPDLPEQGFYERPQMPWLASLEAHGAAIRAELMGLLATDGPGWAPYVQLPPGSGEDDWAHLDRNLDWAAFHLWRHGNRVEAACARCPRTAALLDTLPMMHLAGRSPNASFAILQPGTRLPPHHGLTNIRAIVHLALIVPPDCALRVGGETRPWCAGDAFAFDDTMEHEAWNLSDQPRAILIVDAWNPHLTDAEKALLGVFAEATRASGVDGGALPM